MPTMPLHAKGSSPAFPPGWCTNMLICIDGSYYVGMTNDLAQRIHDHRENLAQLAFIQRATIPAACPNLQPSSRVS